MPIFGVTGGIACGKSAFTRRLALLLDARTIDADLVVHRLLESDAEVLQQIRETFGAAVFTPTGAIRRAALREVVFADEEKRRALEAILHPRVRRAWRDWVEEQLQSAPSAALLVEIPLLYETQAEALFDRVLVVACAPATQLQRLAEIRNLPIEAARRIVASQLDLQSKIQRADHVIWNDGDEGGLETQAALCARYLSRHPTKVAPSVVNHP